MTYPLEVDPDALLGMSVQAAPMLRLVQSHPQRFIPIRVLAENKRPVPELAPTREDLEKIVEATFRDDLAFEQVCMRCGDHGERCPNLRVGYGEARCMVEDGAYPLTDCPATDDADGVHEPKRWKAIEANTCPIEVRP